MALATTIEGSSPRYQTTFIELGIECEDREETAWAGGWTENPDDTGDFEYQFDPDSTWSGYSIYMSTLYVAPLT